MNFEGSREYEFIESEKEFKLELTEFHPNTFYCYTEGVPYALLIGKPINNSQLPKKISILSYCEDRIFDVGEILTIKPTEKPKRTESMSLIYLVKDTIIGGVKKQWLLGSENKTIWGIPILKEKDCKLNNGKYKVVYDEQFSNHPKFEFELSGQNLTEINSDKKRMFKLEPIGRNSFRLNSLEKRTDSLTDLEKALISQGNPYYEIINCKKDTIEFTMRVNLHVISHSGKFVRIN